MTDLVKQHFNRAVVRMESQSDKGHSEHNFEASDLVFLNFQSYIQSSLAHQSNQKHAFMFLGPFCHTPFRERGNEAPIRVPRMFKSHAWQQLINRCNVINKRVIFLT
jgi:hypothetical protein